MRDQLAHIVNQTIRTLNRLEVPDMARYATHKDQREEVTSDRIASRKARAARAARDDKRASTKSARRYAYKVSAR